MTSSRKDIQPLDPDKPIHVRVQSRLSGRMYFGKPGDENTWVASKQEAFALAKEQATNQSESLNDLQVHIRNHKNGKCNEIFSDRANELE